MAASSEHPPVRLSAIDDTYLIVNAATGMEPGAYYYDRPARAFDLLKPGNFRGEAGYLLPRTAARDGLLGAGRLHDRPRAHTSSVRNRGYGDAHLEAGILGGRAYLAAYSLGRGATGLRSTTTTQPNFSNLTPQGRVHY